MCGDDLALEITVLSAESLSDPSSSSSSSPSSSPSSLLLLFFFRQQRLRPYAALSISNSGGDGDADAVGDRDGDGAYRTRVDEEGAHNPTWGDTLLIPVGPAFLADAGAAVNLSVLSQGCCGGAGRRPALLGSCRIPSADIFDGLRPPAARRRLSYALRSAPYHHHHRRRRPCGVVHVAVRAVGRRVDQLAPPPLPPPPPPQLGWARVAVGIPVAAGGHEIVSSGGGGDRGGRFAYEESLLCHSYSV